MFEISSINRLFNEYFQIPIECIVDSSLNRCFIIENGKYYFKYKFIDYNAFLEFLSKFNSFIPHEKLVQFLQFLQAEFNQIINNYEQVLNKQ